MIIIIMSEAIPITAKTYLKMRVPAKDIMQYLPKSFIIKKRVLSYSVSQEKRGTYDIALCFCPCYPCFTLSLILLHSCGISLVCENSVRICHPITGGHHPGLPHQCSSYIHHMLSTNILRNYRLFLGHHE